MLYADTMSVFLIYFFNYIWHVKTSPYKRITTKTLHEMKKMEKKLAC